MDRVIKDPTREQKAHLNSGEKVKPSSGKGSGEKGGEVSRVQSGKDPILKDGNKVSEEGGGGGCGGGNNNSKYPSRLHEKLAFLEGKVKRIASDIKKTKEMLDMNNPDSSKVILSDIQDKISGIEKAMVHVTGVDSGSSKMGLLLKSDDSNGNSNDDKECESDGCKREGEGKSLIKGLNSEELEARLFPHHKLIRNRTITKESSSGKPKEEDNKVVSSVDENSIELEFLASLNNKEASKGGGEIRCCEVQETEGGANGMKGSSSGLNQRCDSIDMLLAADEKLEDFDDQENRQGSFIGEETDEAFNYKLNEIGNKNAAGGWFVSEGEAVLLAHDDGSCSYYDIANCEVCKLVRNLTCHVVILQGMLELLMILYQLYILFGI